MRIENLERMRKWLVPFVFHWSYFWSRLVPKDARCILTHCEASELSTLLVANDGNVYDALALKEWATRCKLRGQKEVQVIPGVTLHSCAPATCMSFPSKVRNFKKKLCNSRKKAVVRKKRKMLERVLMSYHPRTPPGLGLERVANIPSERSAFKPYTAC